MDGSGGEFGVSGALLLGDLLLGWSDELIEEGLALLDSRAASTAARAEFNRMRTEVTAANTSTSSRSDPGATFRTATSWRALTGSWSTSRRSTASRPRSRSAPRWAAQASPSSPRFGPSGSRSESPTSFAMTCSACSATPRSPESPPGDDLREGKRTVLIALARAGLPATAVRLLDELLGDPELDADQIGCCRAPWFNPARSRRSNA